MQQYDVIRFCSKCRVAILPVVENCCYCRSKLRIFKPRLLDEATRGIIGTLVLEDSAILRYILCFHSNKLLTALEKAETLDKTH